ncbi:sodium:solute symporter family protein [Alicyclobacillus mengziensis]|uniref:Sodium:solute symporter family protein n=1 Tax=Alicyclobacillus mengziensis TaxID=2931921 RepID=A0A9X7Z7F5_9BACL|nr:sodium:solute symporter family protein [Alicyclobacillus mengziensis]QSO47281.1 sodium:solute symporter family protein [Alicyclobacillus mengziensis]
MTAFVISFVILILTTGLSTYLAIRGKKMDMKEWAIGGGSFGTLLFWFLNAGEIFTTFAFLGASGWAYSYGAPGFYILANVALGYVLGYWFLPRIWEISKRYDIYTQADYFRLRFENRWLAVLLAIIGIMALIPYMQLQFTGLSLIIQVVFHGAVNKNMAVLVSGLIILAFVFTAGLRSTAFAAVVKDAFMILVLVAVTVSLGAMTHLGSIGHIFSLMHQKHPSYARLPGLKPKVHYTSLWFMSTIMMTNVGYWMWPQQFQFTASAKSGDTVRRNAIFQPLYALSYFFILLIGFAALLTLPHLKNSNSALLALIAHSYPQWFLGVVGGAAMLIAVVPCAGLLLTLGTIFSKNIYRGVFAPKSSDRTVLSVSRIAIVVATAISLWLTLNSSSTIVNILLVAYSAVSQIGPAFILSLLWRRVTAAGVLVGSIVGLVGITVPSVIHFETSIAFTMNHGFVALLLNIIATVFVSLITPKPSEKAIEVGIASEEQRRGAYTGVAADI